MRALCTGGPDAGVVVSTSRDAAPGAEVIEGSVPTGARLLDAVAVMDRLRSPGGCPWDAQQTHDTLRRYLVEETYELLDALADGDRAGIVEELGDVLLQVLFHARVAQEDVDGFDVDDVAAGLVAKLVHRHPHVFGAGEHVADAAAQELRWDELKAVEKRRESSVDGVALGQPALALAAKLASRAARAGLPVDLVPEELASLDGDSEDRLRMLAVSFAEDVRAAESSARVGGVLGELTAADWLAHWPR